MLTGFKNAVEVDFTLEENKKKIEEAFKQAHAEAGAVYPLIIGGKKVETEKKIASVSPATKEVLGYACSCSKEQADEAIKASYEASWMHGMSLKVERTGEKLTENFANSLTLSILM